MHVLTAEERKLWDELSVLCEKSEAFYYVDQFYLKRWFRIFLYRLASYTDFLEPSALECRGTMYEIDIEGKNAKPLRLAARPPQKFFNYHENPFTMDVNLLWDVERVFDKADGSLISSFLIDDVVHLKSKGSLTSDQAMAAERLLNSDAYEDFRKEVFAYEYWGFTVNMEYVAPDNRIVIGYEEPALIVLNARSRISGEYVPHENLQFGFGERACFMYDFYGADGLDQKAATAEFLEQLPTLTGIEGVVVVTKSGLWMKIKTEAYMTAHRAKDSINSPRRLFEAVLEEATDDLRSLFFDDPVALKMIEEMELKVEKIYNHAVDQVERFYERNKHLERKEYAILGQAEVDRPLFGLAMNKYIGREVDYKAFMRKNYKEFGIKDDPEPTGDE